MNAVSEYVRLIMYPLLTVLCVYGLLYFSHFRWLFLSLALFFSAFGVGLLVLVLGNVELNTWMRTNMIPFLQLFIVIALVRTLWRSHRWISKDKISWD